MLGLTRCWMIAALPQIKRATCLARTVYDEFGSKSDLLLSIVRTDSYIPCAIYFLFSVYCSTSSYRPPHLGGNARLHRSVHTVTGRLRNIPAGLTCRAGPRRRCGNFQRLCTYRLLALCTPFHGPVSGATPLYDAFSHTCKLPQRGTAGVDPPRGVGVGARARSSLFFFRRADWRGRRGMFWT